jgi:hypothetical protein
MAMVVARSRAAFNRRPFAGLTACSSSWRPSPWGGRRQSLRCTWWTTSWRHVFYSMFYVQRIISMCSWISRVYRCRAIIVAAELHDCLPTQDGRLRGLHCSCGAEPGGAPCPQSAGPAVSCAFSRAAGGVSAGAAGAGAALQPAAGAAAGGTWHIHCGACAIHSPVRSALLPGPVCNIRLVPKLARTFSPYQPSRDRQPPDASAIIACLSACTHAPCKPPPAPRPRSPQPRPLLPRLNPNPNAIR